MGTEAVGKQEMFIRPYRAQDRRDVREICLYTAFRNLGGQAFFEDRELFADYWTKYYTDYEPESLFVVDAKGSPVGYLMGCVDTRRFVRTVALRVAPPIVARILFGLAARRYRKKVSYTFLHWLLRYSWKEAPAVPAEKYPAHLHFNVLPSAYRKKFFTGMCFAFVDFLERRSIELFHFQALEPVAGGAYMRLFRKFYGSRPVPESLYYAEKPSTLHKFVLGIDTPMVNRVWGFRTVDFRLLVEWIAEHFRV
jgi:hypothetical protein